MDSNNNTLDIVVITHSKDFALAKVLIRSVELYCPYVSKIHVMVDAHEKDLWSCGSTKVNIVIKESLWPKSLPQVNGYKKQVILKLLSYQLAESNFIWILDSDMLLTNSITPNELGITPNKKISWFYGDWNETNSIWRKDGESLLGFEIPYYFMEDPFYIFRKDVLQDFLSKYPISDLLKFDHVSEFVCYGAFVYQYYQNYYQFIPAKDATFAKCVNQIPPHYLVLDENVKWQNSFNDCSVLAIWSHWHLALSKMIEFYHDSQLYHFGEIKDKIDITRQDYLINSTNVNLKYVKGLYSDGWVEKELNISLPSDFAGESLYFTFNAPNNITSKQAVTCQIQIASEITNYNLAYGNSEIQIAIPQNISTSMVTIKITFEGGFKSSGSSDTRHFYAKLLKISCQKNSVTQKVVNKLKNLAFSIKSKIS